ncbi:MAG: aspartate ammonia-lyase [Polyangiaceae bacterium]|nr:aspartate ammonia-lyase [Polyangiaceae bacterium]
MPFDLHAPSTTRTEHDLLGERTLPADALHGIHTARAVENFPLTGRPIRVELVQAYGAVKLACLDTNAELGSLPKEIVPALRQACEELARGELTEHVLVDALQGGAGTSTNMNVNEVLANRALVLLGRSPGEYAVVSPSDHVNLHQSTNDTFPTALRVAAIRSLRRLEPALVGLVEAFQTQEKALAEVVKVGRTELMDAALVTLGREMGAYAEAFGRDRWRVYKCEERLRTVNLGGTAVGTGVGAPREYVFRVVERLRAVTGIGLARAENLLEATQNADVFVEVSGILKALTVNLMKVSGDLRLLGSGPDAGFGELRLPARQAGSSIMPGKVNPVIPEAVTQVAIQVQASDTAVAQAAGLGSLELNPFLPLIAEHLLGSIDLLTRAATLLHTHCVDGLEANRERCRAHVAGAVATATALVEPLGYERATTLAQLAARTGRPLATVVVQEGAMTAEALAAATAPEAVNCLGSRRARRGSAS